jgi:hypothetical protein
MKCIDSIVDFIFDKIFQTSSIPELQLKLDKFTNNLNITSSDKPSILTDSTILDNSKVIKETEKLISPIKAKKLKFDESFKTASNKKSDVDNSSTPRFIKDSKDSEEIFVRNPDNITQDESAYQDLSSLIKNLKHPSGIDSTKKIERRKTLKEIMGKNQEKR